MKARKEILEEKVALLKDIASNFRPNTNIESVIRYYEDVLKEISKKNNNL